MDKSEAYPNGVDHLDPIGKQLAGHALPKLAIEAEQLALSRRLVELTRSVLASWMAGGLVGAKAPSRAAVAQRLRSHRVVAEGLGAHAEAIALEGILDPAQSARCLAIVWNSMGPEALLDPSLSTRLKLTRTQREEVRLLLDRKDLLAEEIADQSRSLMSPRGVDPSYAEKSNQLNQEAHRQLEAAGLVAYEVLTRPQARALKRLLNPDASAGRPGARRD